MRKIQNSRFLWLISVILILSFGMQAQEGLTYEVKVERSIVSFFAVDSKGNPVYDLTKDELKFYINGKTIEFSLFPTVHNNRDINKAEPTQAGRIDVVPDNRIIFIVVDTMFNSKVGMIRTKEIIKDLIHKRFPGKRFVIMVNVLGKGIKHVIGPENNIKKLTNHVGKLKLYPGKTRDFLFLDQDDTTHAPLMKRDIRIDQGTSDLAFKKLEDTEKKFEIQGYKQKIKQFIKSLSTLKTTLKSIPGPKMVFLISEGPSKGGFHQSYKSGSIGKTLYTQNGMMYNPFLLKSLKKAAVAVNLGGSVLFTINPKRPDMVSMEDTFNMGDTSLKYLANESGGVYFEGQELGNLMTKIQKTLSAGYELVFSMDHKIKKKQKIKIKCNRRGVKIFIPKFNKGKQ